MSIEITPAFWGPHGWIFLHSVTFNYPDNPSSETKQKYKQFFESIGDILPCNVCSENYKRHIKENPIDPNLNDKNDIIQWLINIHNMTNIELGKPVLSPLEVIKEFSKKNSKETFTMINCILILCILILIIYIYLYV
jgi:hypothetical protein